MKKALLTIGIIIVAAIIFVFAARDKLIKFAVTKAIEKFVCIPVSMETFSLDISGKSASIKDFKLYSPSKSPENVIVSVPEAKIVYNLSYIQDKEKYLPIDSIHLKKVVIEKLAGAPVNVDSFFMDASEESVEIKGVKLLNPPGFPEGVILDIPEISIEYNPSDLTKRKLHLPVVVINLKEVGIVRNRDGKLNVDSLKFPKAEKEEKVKSPKSMPVQVDLLKLSIGIVVYKDYSSGKAPHIKVYEVNMKNRMFKNIPSIHQLIMLTLKESMKKTAIKSAEIYGIATVAGVAFLPAGLILAFIGKDSATSEFNVDTERAYTASLEAARNSGKVLRENKNRHRIMARADGASVKIKILNKTDETVQVTVSARKHLMPKPQIARSILYQISEELK